VCLLALLAQLALAVAHTWEVAVEAAASAAHALQRLPADTGDTTTVAKASTVSRREPHNPLLCPICQILSQAKHGLVPHRPEMGLLHTSVTVLLGSAFHSSILDLAASVPRAPPYSL
jgi:hypothetical protein